MKTVLHFEKCKDVINCSTFKINFFKLDFRIKKYYSKFFIYFARAIIFISTTFLLHSVQINKIEDK